MRLQIPGAALAAEPRTASKRDFARIAAPRWPTTPPARAAARAPNPARASATSAEAAWSRLPPQRAWPSSPALSAPGVTRCCGFWARAASSASTWLATRSCSARSRSARSNPSASTATRWCGLAVRPNQWPSSATTPTLSRSTTSGRSTVSSFSSANSCRGAILPRSPHRPTGASLRSRRSYGSDSMSPAASSTLTPTRSCTETSSPRTSGWPRTEPRNLATSAWQSPPIARG